MKQKKILIIEDNVQNLEIYGLFLKSKGYSYTSKSSGMEGWDEFEKGPPDLLIIDIGIPDLDGLTIIKRIHENFLNWSGAILAITAYAQAGDMEKILDAGANAYLSKPIKMKTFLEKIKVLLSE